jgi:hypothetical protein
MGKHRKRHLGGSLNLQAVPSPQPFPSVYYTFEATHPKPTGSVYSASVAAGATATKVVSTLIVRPNRGLQRQFVRELFSCAKRTSVDDRIDRAQHNGLSCRM